MALNMSLTILLNIFSQAFLQQGVIYNTIALAMTLTALGSGLIGIKFGLHNRDICHLPIYSFSSFFQVFFFVFFQDREILGIWFSQQFTHWSVAGFLIIEITCIYYFFFKTEIISIKTKKILAPALTTFFLLFVYSLYNTEITYLTISNTFFLESIFILYPCFSYIYQLFKVAPTLNLLAEPAFWFTSGLIIFFVLSLPAFFMSKFFTTYQQQNVFILTNYIGYIIVFTFLSIAFVCKPKALTSY